MNITWFNEEAKNIVATITPKNITINKAGVHFLSLQIRSCWGMI